VSADTYHVLNCDAPGCDAATHWAFPTGSPAEVRRIRREIGWRTRRATGGGPLLDLCPDHAKETKTP
jgi:hypothetical protein